MNWKNKIRRLEYGTSGLIRRDSTRDTVPLSSTICTARALEDMSAYIVNKAVSVAVDLQTKQKEFTSRHSWQKKEHKLKIIEINARSYDRNLTTD